MQTAMSLLRSYAGPASQYALGSGNVNLVGAKVYNHAVAQVWSRLLSGEVVASNPRPWLPVHMGGRGAASAETRVYAAPLGAWAAVADESV